MTTMETKQEIELLRDDANYYGVMGKRYLSNSDINALLFNPASFGKPKEKTPEMLKGSYLHTLLLEPEKISNFMVYDGASRNNKGYKEQVPDGDVWLLASEVQELNYMAEAIRSNMLVWEMLYDDVTAYEMPATGVIGGLPWKGKADVVKADVIYDVKTTSKIDEFMFSARKYNYDSQAWIYNQLFGKPVVFIAVEKETNRIGVFDCSDEFLDRGREKVMRAIEQYNKFFGESKTDDPSTFIIKATL